jgi:two-component system nitrate/nitrite response regulator NarL
VPQNLASGRGWSRIGGRVGEMQRKSVAFVDDHPVLLEDLVANFSARADYAVVGIGNCAGDALIVATRQRPDVIVIDLNMPGDPFEVIAKITQFSPATKVLAFTASAGVDYAVRALEAGVSGYVLKGSSADELSEAIRKVLTGETFITPSFATKVIVALRDASLRKLAARAIKLSLREDQIVKLLLRGRTNKEIANQLNISEKTVKHYMTLLMQKLNVRNRLEVIIAAQKLGEEYRDQGSARSGLVN